MTRGSRVLVLGYGEMGHAMEALLAPRAPLRIWQRPAPGRTVAPLETLAAEAEVVLLCVPTQPHRELAARLRPHLPADAICLTVAKGLDDSGATAAEVLAATLAPGATHGVLYGPMIGEELRAGRSGFAQLGLSDPGAAARAIALFAGSALHVQPGGDLIGLSWCAVLKNVYAILLGMAEGLGLGDNLRGYLVTAALAEMTTSVRALGGDPASVYALAGVGDLITTATSAGSHHHALGRQLARGERGALRGEGVHTLAVLHAHPRLPWQHYPLLAATLRCVLHGAPAHAALAQILAHPFP
jgi:glycerol-3-phosphate dehydrogenase (NAD(P)+)